jgi:hypothetical protein
MRAYTLTHLGDAVLLRDLGALVAQDRITTATLLAHIAEVDARRLYLQNGHPSMFAYCVDELRLSEGGAYKRIQAARAARAHPVIFAAVADGRLHLTAVRLLAPYLTPENADELLAAATHRRRPEIEQLLAQRFPPLRAPAPTVRAIPSEPMRKRVLGPVASPPPPPPERYSVHVAIDRNTHDKLRYAQELLSHCVPSGDLRAGGGSRARRPDRAARAAEVRRHHQAAPSPSRERTYAPHSSADPGPKNARMADGASPTWPNSLPSADRWRELATVP